MIDFGSLPEAMEGLDQLRLRVLGFTAVLSLSLSFFRAVELKPSTAGTLNPAASANALQAVFLHRGPDN